MPNHSSLDWELCDDKVKTEVIVSVPPFQTWRAEIKGGHLYAIMARGGQLLGGLTFVPTPEKKPDKD